MSSWYRLDLGNGMDALPKTTEVEREFTALFISSGRHPTGALLFSRYDRGRDNVELFFNPEAGDIARRHDAIPCEKPAQNGYRMVLLSADVEGALLTHFPGQSAP